MAFTSIDDILIDGQNVDKSALREYLKNRDVVKSPRADFGAKGDGLTNDTAALKDFFAWLSDDPANYGVLGPGRFLVDDTIEIAGPARSIIGVFFGGQRTGSTGLATTLVWAGGAKPMFKTATARHRFVGFGVETDGLATDFLEMNSGSQAVTMEDVYFHADSFTRSVVRSNGNRAGYSTFHRVYAPAPAPSFLDIDGQGTPNAITPIKFLDCYFVGRAGTGGDDPWTVVKINDERVEALRFRDCTIISRKGVVVVDSTSAPLAETVGVLDFTNNEIDEVSGASFRMFRLANVANFCLDKNVISGVGSDPSEYLADLAASHVTSCHSNRIDRVLHLFTADSASTVRGVGQNNYDPGNVWGITDSLAATTVMLTQASAVWINGRLFSPDVVGQYILPVTAAGTYTIHIDTTRPEGIEPGQVFELTIRNESGGVISPPAFGAAFAVQSGGIAAPAPGQQHTTRFMWDGSKARQISTPSPEVPIA